MNAMWSEAKARVSHRLATHLRVEPFRLLNETPMVSFTFDDIPKSAATTGAQAARGPRRPRDLLCFGRAGRHDVAANGPPSMARTSSTCTAMAMRSAATPFPTSGPAISMRRRWPRRSRAIAAICARSTHPSRSRTSPIPSVTDRSGASASSRPAFQSCRSIVPGINSGTVDLQFLRAMPLIDRRIGRDEIERAFDEAQTYNGWLIFYTHDVADRPSPYGCSPAAAEPCPGGGIAPENPGSEHGGGVAMRGRLNAFFAISVNSPSMSMVNFSCCVCSALIPARAWRDPKSNPSADACGSSNGSWGPCLSMTNR